MIIATDSSSPCSNGWHSAWVGIGGWSSGTAGLMQNGIGHSATNTTYAWWEVLGQGHDPGEQRVSISVADRQVINISTEYFPGSGYVQFGFHNLTTGQNQPTSLIFSVDGQPTSFYRDGRDGEVIDERPTVSGSIAPLRQFGKTIWSNAVFYQTGSSTANPIRSGPEDGVIMVSSHTLATPDGTGYASDAFEDDWVACS